MGPALETFLGVALLIALTVGGAVLMTRPFWLRIANYFRRWHERDMRLEQQQREEADCREKARREVGELCHDAERRPQTAAAREPNSRQEANQADGRIVDGSIKSMPETASERILQRTGEQTAPVTPERAIEQPVVGQIELHR